MFEKNTACQLEEAGVPFKYEAHTLSYIQPSVVKRYIADFWLLRSGIIIETKGRFTAADRQKMAQVIEQNPKLDIRMLFMRDQPLNKGAKMTYSQWCDKRGIKYAIGKIPEEWLKEEYNERS